MSEFRFNGKTILYLSLIIIVAFGGVLTGSWFINWRNSNVEAENLSTSAPVIKTNFTMNTVFPKIDVVDIRGAIVSTHDYIFSQNSIILFLSPGCDPCSDVIKRWKKYKDQIPDGCQVIGICETDYESGKYYITETGFPFTVLFDTSYIFSSEYDVHQFPNVMGLNSKGETAFLNRGLYYDYSPLDACAMISDPTI